MNIYQRLASMRITNQFVLNAVMYMAGRNEQKAPINRRSFSTNRIVQNAIDEFMKRNGHGVVENTFGDNPCPYCHAEMTKEGECNNPRCPGDRSDTKTEDVGFTTPSPEAFNGALKAAKNSVNGRNRWRVDSGKSVEELGGLTRVQTPGGSTFAISDDGDIEAVCRHARDGMSGTDLIQEAVKRGGRKLDAFDGIFHFYCKNGFEPVSVCKFNPEYAPDGWKAGRLKPEDVIFFKYTGRNIGAGITGTRAEQARAWKKKLAEWKKSAPTFDDYDDAKNYRNRNMGK